MRSLSIIAILTLAGCGGGGTDQSVAPPMGASIVFIGDSITVRWNPLPVVGAANEGVSGETSQQIAARFSTDTVGAHTVILLAGTNDELQDLGDGPSYVESMAFEARDAGMTIILCELPPIASRDVTAFNQALVTFAQDNNFPIADYYDAMVGNPALFVDGIHPTAAGYALMWKQLQPLM